MGIRTAILVNALRRIRHLRSLPSYHALYQSPRILSLIDRLYAANRR